MKSIQKLFGPIRGSTFYGFAGIEASRCLGISRHVGIALGELLLAFHFFDYAAGLVWTYEMAELFLVIWGKEKFPGACSTTGSTSKFARELFADTLGKGTLFLWRIILHHIG